MSPQRSVVVVAVDPMTRSAASAPGLSPEADPTRCGRSAQSDEPRAYFGRSFARLPKEVTTSFKVTMFGWETLLRSLISRVSVRGNPSLSWCFRIFFKATRSFVPLSVARNTLPYVPSPICIERRHSTHVANRKPTVSPPGPRADNDRWTAHPRCLCRIVVQLECGS